MTLVKCQCSWRSVVTSINPANSPLQGGPLRSFFSISSKKIDVATSPVGHLVLSSVSTQALVRLWVRGIAYSTALDLLVSMVFSMPPCLPFLARHARPLGAYPIDPPNIAHCPRSRIHPHTRQYVGGL